MNNKTRLELLKQAKTSGYTGSYIDLFRESSSSVDNHIDANTRQEIQKGLEGAPYGSSATLNFSDLRAHVLEGRQDHPVKVTADGNYQGVLFPGEEKFIVDTSSEVEETPMLKYGGIAVRKNKSKKTNRYQGDEDSNIIKTSSDDPNIYPGDKEFTWYNPKDVIRWWTADDAETTLSNAREKGFDAWKDLLPNSISDVNPALYNLEGAFNEGVKIQKTDKGKYYMPFENQNTGKLYISEDHPQFNSWSDHMRSKGYNFYRDEDDKLFALNYEPNKSNLKETFLKKDVFNIYANSTKVTEGTELTGYIPTDGSGVTIAQGWDIGQFSKSQVKSLLKDYPELVKKVLPYAGLKTRSAVNKAGLNPEDLTIDKKEAAIITNALFNKFYDSMKDYVHAPGVTEGDLEELFQLKHWAGSLGNTHDGKLAIKKGKNYLWQEIRDKEFTTQEIYNAIKKTISDIPASEKVNDPSKGLYRTARYNHLVHTLERLDELLKNEK